MWKFQRRSLKFIILLVCAAQAQWGGIQNSQVLVGDDRDLKLLMEQINGLSDRISGVREKEESQLLDVSMKLQMLESHNFGLHQDIWYAFESVNDLKEIFDEGASKGEGGPKEKGVRKDEGVSRGQGVSKDGGVPKDTGAPKDAGVPEKAGVPENPGVLKDAAVPKDAGTLQAAPGAIDEKTSKMLQEIVIGLSQQLNLAKTESANGFKWLDDQMTVQLNSLDFSQALDGVIKQFVKSYQDLQNSADQELERVFRVLGDLNGSCVNSMVQNTKSLASLLSFGPTLSKLTLSEQRQIYELATFNQTAHLLEKAFLPVVNDKTKVAIPEAGAFYSSCGEAVHYNGRSGVYWIRAWNQKFAIFQAYCKEDPDGGDAWMIIQRRNLTSGDLLDFKRDWKQYKEGFGDLNSDHWLGLQHIFTLTNHTTHQLWTHAENEVGAIENSYYDNFKIAGEEQNFSIVSMGRSSGVQELKDCVNVPFHTFDRSEAAWDEVTGGGGFWGPCRLNFNQQVYKDGSLKMKIVINQIQVVYMHFAIRPVKV